MPAIGPVSVRGFTEGDLEELLAKLNAQIEAKDFEEVNGALRVFLRDHAYDSLTGTQKWQIENAYVHAGWRAASVWFDQNVCSTYILILQEKA